MQPKNCGIQVLDGNIGAVKRNRLNPNKGVHVSSSHTPLACMSNRNINRILSGCLLCSLFVNSTDDTLVATAFAAAMLLFCSSFAACQSTLHQCGHIHSHFASIAIANDGHGLVLANHRSTRTFLRLHFPGLLFLHLQGIKAPVVPSPRTRGLKIIPRAFNCRRMIAFLCARLLIKTYRN